MPVHLILFQGGQRLGLDLKDGVYRIGRDEPADIVVPERTLSSVHAELQVMGSSVLLRDLGSTNGTFVNEEPVRAARELKPSDKIRLGAVYIGIEVQAEAAKKESTARTAPVVPAVKQQTEVLRAASGRVPWTVRYWLAGLYTILFMLALFLFAQLYYGFSSAQWRLESRFQTLAAQYTHVLAAPDVKAVPPPMVDRSLGEPLLVANREGKIIYPADFGAEIKSPLVDAKTGKVYDAAKVGLVSATVPGAEKGQRIPVRSYPVRNGGDIVGYVIARPAEQTDSELGSAIAMIAVAALAAVVLLFFTLKPVTSMVRMQLQSLKEKVVPLANGFVDALPRSRSVPELSELAEEIEKAIRVQRASDAPAQAKGSTAGREFDARLPELLEAARYPYCFLDNDFKILMMSDELLRIRELAAMRVGRSIFDSSATSIQSKQLVQAMTTAREDKRPSLITMDLERDGTSMPFRITAIAFPAGGRGQVYGLLIAPAA